MKKRIFSLVLSLVMLVSASVAFADQPEIGDEPNTFYEGNKPFVLMEKLLNELNEDKEADIFDADSHGVQFGIFESVDLSSVDLSEAISHLTEDMSDAQKMYLYAQVEAEENEEFRAVLDDIDNVADCSLRESFGKLDNYIEDMLEFLDKKDIDADDYNDDLAVQESAKAIVAEPLMAILEVLFAENKAEMREGYYNDFLTRDRPKKTLSVLFGARLTAELVKDSFILDQPDETIGIVHHVREYIKNADPETIRTLKNDLDNVLVAGAGASVTAAFDILGELVAAAYENESVKDDVVMLMGDGENEGLLELLIKAVDEANNYKASGIWVNLLLSEFVQMNLAGSVAFNTINAQSINPARLRIANGTEVFFKNEKVSDYGLNDGTISLNESKFALRFFAEDPQTPGTYAESSYITYSDGKITVTRDSNQPAEYKAYVTVYRGSYVEDDSTFIESYPVTVVNYKKSSGGGSSKVYITYNTNGGQAIGSTSHTRGTTVQLNKVPVREGYIFTGWYSDAALTQKIDSVTVTASTTVYAGWEKDGAVVSVVEVPEILEGDHHYAYIMGYPQGDVRPYGNITRAETATMVFRLLKDSVRTANLTETNKFSDVNDGDWFNTAVSTLAGMGIVVGRTETEFMPNENITRAEFATIFARLAEYNVVAEKLYGDVDRHWAAEHIYEASSYGWIEGYEDETFRPDKAINRAEAMTLVNRVLKRVPESKDDLLPGMTVWADNADENTWYYIAVQEATNSHDHVMKDESFEKWTELTENRDWTIYER